MLKIVASLTEDSTGNIYDPNVVKVQATVVDLGIKKGTLKVRDFKCWVGLKIFLHACWFSVQMRHFLESS